MTGDIVTSQTTTPTPAQVYEEYYRPAIFEPLSDVLLDHARPRTGERVLDVACGTGIVTRRVPPLVGTGGRVVGVDINPGMIDVARSLTPPDGTPVEWRHGDAVALDLEDGAFDLVLCQQGLQFFANRAAALREMRRVLADEGRVAIAAWHGIEDHPLFAALGEAELAHLGDLGVAVTAADLFAPFSLGEADELRHLLTDAGFSDVEISSASIEARFATPERFIERMEFAFAAVIPRFAQDPAAFTAFVDQVSRETQAIVERYRQGDFVLTPMHTNIAVART
jgi:ubiquinone/menaquinone biosynthesis C-methylase UbiE